MNSKYFITVQRCNTGIRGIFCDINGNGFSKETPHTKEEMNKIIGIFEVILSPKSELFTEKETKLLNMFKPLAEYTNQYGIAFEERNEQAR